MEYTTLAMLDFPHLHSITDLGRHVKWVLNHGRVIELVPQEMKQGVRLDRLQNCKEGTHRRGPSNIIPGRSSAIVLCAIVAQGDQSRQDGRETGAVVWMATQARHPHHMKVH